jgi:hypothetical protein
VRVKKSKSYFEYLQKKIEYIKDRHYQIEKKMMWINVFLLLPLVTFLVISSENIDSMPTKDIKHKTVPASSSFDDLVNSTDALIASTQTGSISDHLPTSKTFSKTSQVLMYCYKNLNPWF